MATMLDTLYIAWQEALVNVGWKTNKARVFEYIRTSRQRSYVADEVDDPSNSWCGDFVFWVLRQAGVKPLPGDYESRPAPMGSNAIARYTEAYPQVNDPQSGDIYYMPINAMGVQKDHVGFVWNADNPSAIRTIDGNTDGGLGGNISLLVKGLGGGYVTYNTRSPSQTKLFFYRVPYDPETV